MKKNIKFVLVALALVGCATTQEYAFRATRPNMDFSKDKYECLQRAQSLSNADMYYLCMEGRGWKKVLKNSPQSDVNQSPTTKNESQSSSSVSSWIMYYRNENASYYYDKSSIWRNGDTVKVTDSKRFSNMQSLANGKVLYNQVQIRHSLNCRKNQGKVDGVLYIDSTRQGSQIVLDTGGDNKVMNIPKDSIVGLLARTVCE